MPFISGGGGGGPAAGSYIPVADKAGVTVDTTTYTNPVTGSGKIATLMIGDTVAFAFAKTGDAFPRILVLGDPTDGFFWLGDGTFDPYAHGAALYTNVEGTMTTEGLKLNTMPQISSAAAQIGQVSPVWRYLSGSLSTVQLVSGAGAQISTGNDIETYTPVTFNPGAATTATCAVALSPDNITYTTMGVETVPAGVALDGTIRVMRVRVPIGWYVKLTVNAQATLGLTSYA